MTRRITGFIIALMVPLLFGGQVFAATQSITQEITVTAIVPAHRDIILDNTGRIIEIISNTSQDITPHAYRGTAEPANQIPVTPSLMSAYRQIVPPGTARSGILYKISTLDILSGMKAPFKAASTSAAPADTLNISFLLSPRTAVWSSMIGKNIQHDGTYYHELFVK